jgi:hypothetical protein
MARRGAKKNALPVSLRDAFERVDEISSFDGSFSHGDGGRRCAKRQKRARDPADVALAILSESNSYFAPGRPRQ